MARFYRLYGADSGTDYHVTVGDEENIKDAIAAVEKAHGRLSVAGGVGIDRPTPYGWEEAVMTDAVSMA